MKDVNCSTTVHLVMHFLLTFLILHVCMKRDRGWRTFKRPGVDAFLEHLAQFYEIVVYSDQLNMVISLLFFPVLCYKVSSLSPLDVILWPSFGMCSTWILLSIDWIRSTVYDIGYQGLQLNIKMESIIGYVHTFAS